MVKGTFAGYLSPGNLYQPYFSAILTEIKNGYCGETSNQSEILYSLNVI